MERRRGFRAAVCRACGTAWTSRSARFCGHCGAALDPAEVAAAASKDATAGAPPGDAGASRGSGSGRGPQPATRRRLIRIGVAAAVLVVVAVAAVMGDTVWEPDPRAEDPAGVELPEPEDVDDAAAGQPPPVPGAPPAGLDGAEVACEPEGCALWAISRRSGPTVVTRSVVVVPVPGGDPEELGEEELRLQGLSLVDGLPVWEAGIGLPLPDHGGSGYSLHPLGDEHLVLEVEGTILLLDAIDGTLRWGADLGHGFGFAGTIDEDHLLVVGRPAGAADTDARVGGAPSQAGEAPGAGGWSEPNELTSSVLDPTTGEVLWSTEGRRVVTVVGDRALFVDSDHTRVEARDLSTGEVAWERDVQPDPRRTLQRLDGDRIVLFRRGGLQVVAAQDGALLAEVDLDLSGDPNVQVVGDLVIVVDGHPGDVIEPQPRSGKLIDLREPDAEPRRLQGLVQAIPLFPAHGTHSPWARSDPTGIALAFQADERFEFRVLEPDGTVRWSSDGEFEEPTCCVRVHPAGDDDRLIVVPPTDDTGPPTIVSSHDGSHLGTFLLPEDLDAAEPIRFFGDLAVVQDGIEPGVVLAGDGGYVRVTDGSLRHVGPPVPVVEGADGLLGIDPALLFEQDRLREGGWRGAE